MSIRIVTDSTCDLPPALAEQYGIVVLPCYINIGERSYLDGVNLSREEFYTNLPTYSPLPTTAAPGIEMFREAYVRLRRRDPRLVHSFGIQSQRALECGTDCRARNNRSTGNRFRFAPTIPGAGFSNAHCRARRGARTFGRRDRCLAQRSSDAYAHIRRARYT